MSVEILTEILFISCIHVHTSIQSFPFFHICDLMSFISPSYLSFPVFFSPPRVKVSAHVSHTTRSQQKNIAAARPHNLLCKLYIWVLQMCLNSGFESGSIAEYFTVLPEEGNRNCSRNVVTWRGKVG
jgi:hypothetical protein